MIRKVMVLAGLLVLGVAAAARAQQPIDAASLYAKTCASCHGPKGTPSAGMASMHIPDFAASAFAAIPDSTLRNTVAAGKGRMMPSYKTRLTTEQIAALVGYIRTFGRH
jgi:mono/diheme cytochrome c family protein